MREFETNDRLFLLAAFGLFLGGLLRHFLLCFLGRLAISHLLLGLGFLSRLFLDCFLLLALGVVFLSDLALLHRLEHHASNPALRNTDQ